MLWSKLFESDPPLLDRCSFQKLCETGASARASALRMLSKLHSLIFNVWALNRNLEERIRNVGVNVLNIT